LTFKEIKTEVKENPEKRSRFIIFLFRYSFYLTNKKNPVKRILGRLIGSIYAFYTGWILGIDLSYSTKIGNGLKIFHGFGIVIHADAILGKNVVIRQNTTIGQAKNSGKSPIIGNNVDIGANCIIIGDITIGDNCIIGAGSLVNKNFLENSVIVGNPAHVIRNIDQKNK